MKTSIIFFLSTIIFLLTSCKKESLFVSCDSSTFSVDETKNTLIGKWQLISYCENGKILSVEDDIIWEYAKTFNDLQIGVTRQLHRIETTNNIQTASDTIELIGSDYIQFFFWIEYIPYPKRLDICTNEFTLKYIDRQGNTIWAKYFERI